MATIDSRLLFVTTSPRSPEKMIPEIELLDRYFNGQEWNHATQVAFMSVLRNEDFFQGSGAKDPAFSARDRINRGPKSLGFVNLKPTVSLTPAGMRFISSEFPGEVLLRQMLKFQIPSPYHKPSASAAKFNVRPFLEILRLVRVLEKLRFDELRIIALQLTDWHSFEYIVHKIHDFRNAKIHNTGNYRVFAEKYLENELRNIFADRIEVGNVKTRENADTSVANFLATQARNTRDYADAFFRYLRATGLVAVSHIGKSLTIVPERIEEVDYILNTIPRDAFAFKDEISYSHYLGDDTIPELLPDNREYISGRISREFPDIVTDRNADAVTLRKRYASLLLKRKSRTMARLIDSLKNYSEYDDIQMIFDRIVDKKIYDAPLMLEWNTWRAMTMIDGGDIAANLKFDDYGNPMCTAQGNMPDIVCDYGDFMVCVEVTMQSGQRQFETEHESVLRHLGKLKVSSDRPCYTLFIAPDINPSCITYFYTMHHVNLALYGGTSVIVPLPLGLFRHLLARSFSGHVKVTPRHIRSIFDMSMKYAMASDNEQEWFNRLCDEVQHIFSA
ncbi:MAG: AlwI family type II restriction endonuclease [Bacteroidales bacterium]|nr:AlwI family type II restriction endonuclease [Bacteroidales bacterium]